MSKVLFLLTKKFPYGHQEAYLFDELKVLKDHFEQVIIVPYDEFDYDQKKMRLKEDLQVKVFRINKAVKRLTIFQKWKAKKKAVQWFDVDLQKRLDKESVNKHRNQYLIQMKHALAQANALKTYIDGNFGSLSEVILYNYWLHRGILVSGELKEQLKNKQVKVVSRAHSYDIYHDHWFQMFEEANPKFLPFLYYKLYICESILPISAHGYHFMKDQYGIDEGKMKVARLGVIDYALQEQIPPPNASGENQFLIVTCSWITNLKRIYLMPELISKLNLNVHWVHFGSGDDMSMNQLMQEIEKYKLENKCEIRGKVDHSEIIRFYQENHVDLFVNLSVVEGIPVALMEAACFGIPMVATNTVGNPEIVNDENGILIPVDFDMNQVAEAIKNTLQDQKVMYQKSQSSRRTYEELYEAQRNYSNLAKYLKSEHGKN